jgi:hypothetical protein
MQPSFIGKNYKFQVKDTIVYCLHKPVAKICSLVIAIFTAGTCLILYGGGCNLFVTLHAAVVEICAW